MCWAESMDEKESKEGIKGLSSLSSGVCFANPPARLRPLIECPVDREMIVTLCPSPSYTDDQTV